MLQKVYTTSCMQQNITVFINLMSVFKLFLLNKVNKIDGGVFFRWNNDTVKVNQFQPVWQNWQVTRIKQKELELVFPCKGAFTHNAHLSGISIRSLYAAIVIKWPYAYCLDVQNQFQIFQSPMLFDKMANNKTKKMLSR